MSSFTIKQCSCVDMEVDAIVNAANGYMLHDGGIAGAIKAKAGRELDDACHKYNLPISDGENIVTPAFNISNAKIIIHAVGPNFYNTPDAFKELFEAYYNSLISLREYEYHSIAFPLISSGLFGGNIKEPTRKSAKECIRAYNKFINEYPGYDIDAVLCCYSDSEYRKVLDEFNKD